MANEQNLTRMGKEIDSREKAQRLGRMGGLSKSPKKKWAAQLRELKKKGLSNENAKVLASMIEEKESFALNVLISLLDTRKNAPPQLKTTINNNLTSLMKATHGDTLKTENVHHIINWSDMFKECEVEKDGKVQSEKSSE